MMTSDARKRQKGEPPVVTIDLGDIHQVRRLDDLIQKHLDDPSAPQYLSTAVLLAKALSDFANPPRPEEPTGLGAVVEDEDGEKWVRLESAPHWTCDGVGFGHYADIAAVRVLSDGVQP